MIGTCLLILVCVDTLRWYDPATAGYNAIGGPTKLHWAIIFSLDTGVADRKLHSGRFHIYDKWYASYPDTVWVRLCTGTHQNPVDVLDSTAVWVSDSGFYEILYGETFLLDQADTLWFWCYITPGSPGIYPATTDSGPAVRGYGDLISIDGISWGDLADYGLNYNWVMELILTPTDVEEGPAKPEGKLTLLPAPGGFWITGYEGPAQIYDPAGRLLLEKEIKAKTLISPLRPGVYFVMAGRQKARIAIR